MGLVSSGLAWVNRQSWIIILPPPTVSIPCSLGNIENICLQNIMKPKQWVMARPNRWVPLITARLYPHQCCQRAGWLYSLFPVIILPSTANPLGLDFHSVKNLGFLCEIQKLLGIRVQAIWVMSHTKNFRWISLLSFSLFMLTLKGKIKRNRQNSSPLIWGPPSTHGLCPIQRILRGFLF